MKTYTTTVQWFSRHDKEHYPKEDCEVLLWRKSPLESIEIDDYEFFCKGSELTEEMASELVEKGKNSYGELKYENHYDDIGSFMGYDYVLPSFISAVESKGFYWLENPYDKLINVNSDIPSSMVRMVNRINHKEQWKESEEKTFRDPLIFVKK